MVGHPIFKVPSLLTVYVQMEQSSNNIPVIWWWSVWMV